MQVHLLKLGLLKMLFNNFNDWGWKGSLEVINEDVNILAPASSQGIHYW